MKFQEHKLAHNLLDGLIGIEIGGAAHNPFNIKDCLNVDYTADLNTIFKQGERKLCGECLPVDIVSPGDDLPFPPNTWDYVLSSHVLEHFFDPIKAIKEWLRVVRPGGFVFMIVPQARALPGEDRPSTTLQELLDRHENRMKPEEVNMGGYQTSTVTGLPMDDHGHWSVWDLNDFLPVCAHFKWGVYTVEETDTKVGNGWTLVLQK